LNELGSSIHLADRLVTPRRAQRRAQDLSARLSAGSEDGFPSRLSGDELAEFALPNFLIVASRQGRMASEGHLSTAVQTALAQIGTHQAVTIDEVLWPNFGNGWREMACREPDRTLMRLLSQLRHRCDLTEENNHACSSAMGNSDARRPWRRHLLAHASPSLTFATTRGPLSGRKAAQWSSASAPVHHGARQVPFDNCRFGSNVLTMYSQIRPWVW